MIVIRSMITLVLLLGFIGLWFWAWSARRKDDFDAAAMLPLIDGETTNRSEQK